MELAGGADEIRIKYSKALEAVGVEARIEGFTLVGNSPRAKLVVRLGGDTAEFAIRLDRDNTVRLEFTTTNREEAERRAALLRALGVDAETREKHEPPNRVKWRIAVSTNALAADSVHSVVREAVAEFLKLCREANIIT
ncbi:MAG: PaRep2b protein, partial [Pyrobaculum sp.]